MSMEQDRNFLKLIWMLLTLINFILFYGHFSSCLGASSISFVVYFSVDVIIQGLPEEPLSYITSNLIALPCLLCAQSMIHIVVIKMANRAMSLPELEKSSSGETEKLDQNES